MLRMQQRVDAGYSFFSRLKYLLRLVPRKVLIEIREDLPSLYGFFEVPLSIQSEVQPPSQRDFEMEVQDSCSSHQT